MEEINVNTDACLAIDSLGNGVTVGFAGKNPCLINKWDENGKNIWSTGEDNKAVYSAVCVDTTDDSIYALGNKCNENERSEGIIVKYDTHGNPLWGMSMSILGYGVYSTISLTATGDIIVSGDVGTVDKQRTTDACVVKISKDGNLIWETVVSSYQHYLTINDYYLIDTAVDSQGNIYGCGTVDRIVNSPGFLVKLNSEGKLLWKKVIDTRRTLHFTSLAIDADDNVYVGGRYMDEFMELYWTNCNGYLYKWSPDGDKLFEIVESNQHATHMVISYCKKGYLITAGPAKMQSRNTTNLIVRKVSLDGKVMNTQTIIADPFRIKARSLVTCDNGDVFIVTYPKDNTNLYRIIQVEI